LGIKIDISGLVKSLIGSAGIFILGMMFSFIFNWAITKYLPQNEVGFFQYFISIITFAMVIVPLGFQALAQREVVKLNKKSLIQLSKQASISILISSCIFGLLWFFGVKKYKWVKDLKEYSEILSIGSGRGITSIKKIQSILWKRASTKYFQKLKKDYETMIKRNYYEI